MMTIFCNVFVLDLFMTADIDDIAWSGQIECKISQSNKYVFLTKCEVKMAGYWPSFFCVFMHDREGVEVHKLAKEE